MLLYLMRHGEASHSSPDQPSSLTPKGKSDVARMVEHLIQKKHIKLDTIWHSPKTRAIQTAEIVWKALENPALPLEKRSDLSPDGDADQVYRDILGHVSGNLLVVSHLPFLPDLASLLLEGEDPSPTFPTSGIAAFDRGKTFKLLWTLDPSTLK
jgi:phosphohistidine phosphatase